MSDRVVDVNYAEFKKGVRFGDAPDSGGRTRYFITVDAVTLVDDDRASAFKHLAEIFDRLRKEEGGE